MKNTLKKTIPKSILKLMYNWKKRKIDKFYEGNNVECPICKSKYKLFRPHGIRERNNVRCPNCNSFERHRLLWLYLSNKTSVFKSNEKLKILHFAPESSFYYRFNGMDNIEYIACDLFPDQYQFKVQEMDITQISLKDNSVDIIICNHVLEHVDGDLLAMTELHRVMKKGGFGIFQVPINYSMQDTFEDFSITTPEERLKVFGQEDHVRIYGRDYSERLKSVGFEVLVDNYVETLPNEQIFKYGLASDELIYKCVKN